MSEKRETFQEQANHIIQEAWAINGAPDMSEGVEVQLRILNGLLAIALAEVCAPPVVGKLGSLVRLRDVLGRADD